MSKLLIIGAGGHGRMVADVAASTGSWSSIAFLDDEWERLRDAHPWPMLGSCDLVDSMSEEYESIALGFGDNVLRCRWSDRISALDFDLVSIVSPRGIVSEHAELGPGTVVMPGAVARREAVGRLTRFQQPVLACRGAAGSVPL